MSRHSQLHESAAPRRPPLPGERVKLIRCNSLAQWRDEYMPLMMKADFEPHNGTPFDLSFRLPLGLPGVVECRFSAGTLVRRPEFVKDEPDAFHIMTIEEGHVRASDWRGREFHLRRGEAAFLHLPEPGRHGSSVRCGGVGVIVSRAELEARDVNPNGVLLQRLSAQNEALGLLRVYVRSLRESRFGHAEGGPPAALREVVQRHLYDLAALVVSWRGAVGESSLSAVADVRLRAALDYIAAHSDDPQLTIGRVAQAQGISPRYLQRLLEDTGSSYTDIVNKARLQKAFAALTAADQRGRSITDIAMQAGFTGVSHFNRLFRARFGDTPSGVRSLLIKPRNGS